MSTCAHPATPSIAADPVSPLVAPTIVTRSAPLAQHVVEHATDELQRDVLERERRAVEQLLHPLAMVELHERRRRLDGGTSRRPRCTAGATSPRRGRVRRTAASPRPRGRRRCRARNSVRRGPANARARTARRRCQAGEQHIGETRAPGAVPRVETYRIVSRRSRAAGRRCCARRRVRAARAPLPERRTRGPRG